MEYRYYTKREAIELQVNQRFSSTDSASNLHVEYFNHCDANDIIAAVAIDNGNIVGHKLVSPCLLLVDSKPLSCMVGEGTYVNEEFRRKGIGKRLMQNILNLGIPQISTSVSSSMERILDSWNEYVRVDSSPIFTVPVNIIGAIRYSRIELYQNTDYKWALVNILFRNATNMVKFRTKRISCIKILSASESISCLEKVVTSMKFPVQVPWDFEIITRALDGKESGMKAWIIEIPKDQGHSRHLVTFYIKSSRIRIYGSREVNLKEAHLNEIFPPLNDWKAECEVIAFCYNQARQLSIGSIKIYALTDSLANECKKLGLFRAGHKLIYIAPIGLEGHIFNTLVDKDNWWCRAIGEDQFNETLNTTSSSAKIIGSEGGLT